MNRNNIKIDRIAMEIKAEVKKLIKSMKLLIEAA